MRLPIALASAVVLAGSLAACGGGASSDTDDYCSSLEQAQKDFQTLEEGDLGQMDKAFQTFHELADQAPEAVSADWSKIDGAITKLQDGLDEAGIKMSDLEEISKTGELPEGVDQQKLLELGQEIQGLGGEDFEKAGDNITKHAKDECGIELGENS